MEAGRLESAGDHSRWTRTLRRGQKSRCELVKNGDSAVARDEGSGVVLQISEVCRVRDLKHGVDVQVRAVARRRHHGRL